MSFTAAYINFITIIREKPEISTKERSHQDPRAVFYVNFNKKKFTDTIFVKHNFNNYLLECGWSGGKFNTNGEWQVEYFAIWNYDINFISTILHRLKILYICQTDPVFFVFCLF